LWVNNNSKGGLKEEQIINKAERMRLKRNLGCHANAQQQGQGKRRGLCLSSGRGIVNLSEYSILGLLSAV
jgi:hypothetical protein